MFSKSNDMKGVHRKFKHLVVVTLVIIMAGCEKEYFYETPPPDTSQQTSTLEAVFVTSAPTSLNSSYWKTADYLKITASDVSKQHVYGDGLMNMTGTYAGLNSFNNGADPELILKAAYDSENLYILAEWTDLDVNASHSSWLYNGPLDPNKTDLNAGWTSQRNNDKIALAFEISAATSPAGNFSSVGCAASCHNQGSVTVMHPVSGKVDLWNWSLARSFPLGYAEDKIASPDSLGEDNGQTLFTRNATGSSNRSGPAYEWDGTSQNVTTTAGTSAILDPAFYLLNKTTFTGDPQKGDSIYHTPFPPGDCASCHGASGEGGSATAINLLSMNKKTRSALAMSMDIVPDMAPYWGPLSASERDDIIAYMRGLSGVPGYYLNTPSGSCADIKAISNVTPVQISNAQLPVNNVHTKYQVLITRKLNTTNADDVQFDPNTINTVTFGVALMDNDGANHVGSNIETLTFK